MIPHLYVLRDREPVAVDDPMEWARRNADTDRHVAQNKIIGHDGDTVWVSTVFLAIDHNMLGSGPPVLFETMIFGGKRDRDQERYCTWAEAEVGHRKWLHELRRKAGVNG